MGFKGRSPREKRDYVGKISKQEGVWPKPTTKLFLACQNHSEMLRGGIKKNQVFFGVSPKGGEGGLAESKISLAEKTEIFLEKGGGLTYSKRVLS